MIFMPLPSSLLVWCRWWGEEGRLTGSRRRSNNSLVSIVIVVFFWLHRLHLRHCPFCHYLHQSNPNQRYASKAKASWGVNIQSPSCCQRCPSAMWEVRLRSLFCFHDSAFCVHPFSSPYQDPWPFVLIVFSLLVIEVFPNICCHRHLMIKDSSARPSRTSSPWATSPQGQARHWTLLVWPGD